MVAGAELTLASEASRLVVVPVLVAFGRLRNDMQQECAFSLRVVMYFVIIH